MVINGSTAATAQATTPSLFVFPETQQQVRTVMLDGAPWFVAADVCAVLGIGNPTKALYSVGADEKRTVTLTLGKGNPNRALLSESGLYKLIMRSDKPEARKFQAWVTRDVLPAIRKDGVYVRCEEILKPDVVETLDMDDLGALSDHIETLLKRPWLRGSTSQPGPTTTTARPPLSP